MQILHRYILKQFLFNLASAFSALTFLFLAFDFFDRIDNVLAEKASASLVLSYFLLKIPGILVLISPMAILAATLFSIGLLSRNSEMTAMRASGTTVLWLTKPILLSGLLLSLLVLIFNETLVPYSNQRVKEIYNIEIKKKNASGWYSQEDVWWRSRLGFVGVQNFDSRTDTINGLTILKMNDDFSVAQRTEAQKASFLSADLGWSMQDVERYTFTPDQQVKVEELRSLPLPEKRTPNDLYNVETDAELMSYRQLRTFIKNLTRSGVRASQYFTDLANKLAYPFASFFVTLVVIPFALQPARTGSMAQSVIYSLSMAFLYFVTHSLSVSMGRAELLPPLVAAWSANALLLVVGGILFAGAESPG